jgi:hypothetical protein
MPAPDEDTDAGPGGGIGADDAHGPGRDGRPDDGDDTGKHSEAGKHTQSQPGQGPGHGCRPSATWSRCSTTSWRAGARP